MNNWRGKRYLPVIKLLILTVGFRRARKIAGYDFHKVEVLVTTVPSQGIIVLY
jgi:hypothetical protein